MELFKGKTGHLSTRLLVIVIAHLVQLPPTSFLLLLGGKLQFCGREMDERTSPTLFRPPFCVSKCFHVTLELFLFTTLSGVSRGLNIARIILYYIFLFSVTVRRRVMVNESQKNRLNIVILCFLAFSRLPPPAIFETHHLFDLL